MSSARLSISGWEPHGWQSTWPLQAIGADRRPIDVVFGTFRVDGRVEVAVRIGDGREAILQGHAESSRDLAMDASGLLTKAIVHRMTINGEL